MQPISRRLFLERAASAAAGVATTFVAGAAWRALETRQSDDAPVVVVGSGATAIAAATALLRRNIPVLMMATGVLSFLDPPHGLADEEAYETSPDAAFHWHTLRRVGGKLIRWGLHCPRLSPRDFAEAAALGTDYEWPIGYADLEPYYAELEALLGVVGRSEGNPDLPDGRFVGPSGLDPLQGRWAERLGARGVAVTPGRLALRPRPFRGQEHIAHVLCRAPGFSLLPMAEVRRIEPAEAGRPLSVAYYDEAEKVERHQRARKVVLAAGTLESARILLASTSSRFPDGLGNTSGVLGRYLMDHIMVDTDVVVHGGPPPDSIRAYRALFVPNRRYPSLYGAAQFQMTSSNQASRGDGDWQVGLKGFGQPLPNRANHIRLTGRETANGAPVAQVSFRWSPEDLAVGDAIKDDARSLLAGFDYSLVSQATATAGDAIHQVGTCRMGRDPRTSAVDGACRMHDVPDVYVVDGSTWPTLPEKNPTLTMMAIAMRAGNRLGAALARGDS